MEEPSGSLWFKVNRFFGGVILFIATIVYFLKISGLESVASLAFLIPLAFAWTDFSQFVIQVAFGVAAFLAFFAYTIESLFYAIPFAIVFIVYSYLISIADERKAFRLTLFSIPAALAYTYFFPDASPATWAFIGLMLAYNHHTVIEDMAMGDVYIVPLYFMLLGPFALIPYALLHAMGETFFLLKKDNAFPVGPALFVTSIPVYFTMMAIKDTAFIFSYRSITPHPTFAALMFLVGFFYIAYVNAEDLLRGIVGGITAVLVFAVYALAVYWINERTYISDEKMALMGLLGIILAAGAFWGMKEIIKLHHHGGSTVYWEDIHALLALSLAISTGLTAYLLWNAFSIRFLPLTSLIWILVSVALFTLLRVTTAEEWDTRFNMLEGILGGIWLGILFALL